MSVRAKFYFDSFTTQLVMRNTGRKNEDGAYISERVEQRTLVMRPVYSSNPDEENKLFWDASPGGKLELNVVNQEAWKHFELGKHYYLDFTPAD